MENLECISALFSSIEEFKFRFTIWECKAFHERSMLWKHIYRFQTWIWCSGKHWNHLETCVLQLFFCQHKNEVYSSFFLLHPAYSSRWLFTNTHNTWHCMTTTQWLTIKYKMNNVLWNHIRFLWRRNGGRFGWQIFSN